ncbi:MAG: iron-containing alcohol dehydrogenase [Planctomycetota bacterium]|nr:iron-containing alcohol dehydrogenase [Planctomycetota bacterium]
MANDNAFQISSSNLRFGFGCTREVGLDLRELGSRRVLVIVDPAVVDLYSGQTVLESLRTNNIDFALYTDVQTEPTDESFRRATEFAVEGRFDALVAVGGGSTIDTAKGANLYSTHPADFFDYVNAPIGKGLPVPGPLKPLIAIPTTAGTGSETTGTAIFDWRERHVKTGIAHRYLRPTLGIVDPENTRSQPPAVAASTGLDVLSHALESYTVVHYTARPMPARPTERPAYQGNNPISDQWALQALRMVRDYLVRAVEDTTDDEARYEMALASSIAGIGFGNAGVHLPHGMSYPVAGLVKGYRPPGFQVDHPLVPHGISVILNTPAVVRFTAVTDPRRHLACAEALGADITDAPLESAGQLLSDVIVEFMRKLKMPNGLAAVGYTAADIPALVEGTLPQHRVTKLSPRPASPEDLAVLFRESLTLW